MKDLTIEGLNGINLNYPFSKYTNARVGEGLDKGLYNLTMGIPHKNSERETEEDFNHGFEDEMAYYGLENSKLQIVKIEYYHDTINHGRWEEIHSLDNLHEIVPEEKRREEDRDDFVAITFKVAGEKEKPKENTNKTVVPDVTIDLEYHPETEINVETEVKENERVVR